MDEKADTDERAYWVEQVHSRQVALQAAEEHEDPAHVVAGLRLRLQEAEARIRALR